MVIMACEIRRAGLAALDLRDELRVLERVDNDEIVVLLIGFGASDDEAGLFQESVYYKLCLSPLDERGVGVIEPVVW